MKKKAKIGILSLGCPRNLVDSENILGRLNLKGHPVVDINESEVAIVNTCAFIDEAKRESIDAILDLARLKKEGRLKKVIVYGCLAQRYKDELRKELPEVDAFVGRVSLNHSPKRYSLTERHLAYLKICEGCVNNCSFCVIPKIKGKFRSLDVQTLLRQVDIFNKDKISELNIIGQDITGYGLDLHEKINLAGLLKKIISRTPGIKWIRLLYLYPERVSQDLLDLIRSCPKICKYIDLPVQHINDRVLRIMNRGTSKSEILRLLEKVRKTIPGVALRTSVIVGFPSETDKEFKELLDFLKTASFERLGAFMYSREEGTPAYKLKNQIPEKIKQERFNMLMSSQQEISSRNNERFKGSTIDVLIEGTKDGRYLGRSQSDAPEVDGLVYVNSDRDLKQGDIVRVKITDTLEYDLVGCA